MKPVQAVGVGVALIGIFFMASAIVAMLGKLGELSPLIVGAVLFGTALYILDKREGG